MIDAIKRNVTWGAIPVAAVLAGTVFLAIMAVFTPTVLEVETHLILTYIASLVMGSDVLLDTSVSVQIIGALVHYALSFFFTLIIAIVVHRGGLLIGLIGGAILGASFYAINLYTLTGLFNWFFAINSDLLFAAHIAFGIAAGGMYEMLDQFDLPADEILEAQTHERR